LPALDAAGEPVFSAELQPYGDFLVAGIIGNGGKEMTTIDLGKVREQSRVADTLRRARARGVTPEQALRAIDRLGMDALPGERVRDRSNGDRGMRGRSAQGIRLRRAFDESRATIEDLEDLLDDLRAEREGEDGVPGEGELPVRRAEVEERQGWEGEDRRRRMGRDQPRPFYGQPRPGGEVDWHEYPNHDTVEDSRRGRYAQDSRPRGVVPFGEAYPAAARIKLSSLNGI
jgi:hypothetical protein